MVTMYIQRFRIIAWMAMYECFSSPALLTVVYIFFPGLGIGEDISLDAGLFYCATNDMVMIARLPGELDIMLAGESGHTDFITPDDRCQVLRLRAECVFWFL
jgi:hypothetical protein